MMDANIIIIGAGPTGLGAALQLQDLGHSNWTLFESTDGPGGLARSIRDDNGFFWDMGGHVIFSHYQYFNDVLDCFVPDWLYHKRESYVWVRERFVPYPFQKNIHYLPEKDMTACLEGLKATAQHRNEVENHKPIVTFQDWIDKNFGRGLAKIFFNPYNFKVWGYKPCVMTSNWVSDRVAKVDLKSIINSINSKKDDVTWGPNSSFRFPLFGGTGVIWQNVCDSLPNDNVKLCEKISRINVDTKHVSLDSGECVPYDYLINTTPLDIFIQNLKSDRAAGLKDFLQQENDFVHSSSHIIGLGLEGQPREHLSGKCWLYFPEENCDFYRVTVFSNYSPYNVPQPGKQWSLMLEITETPAKPVAEDIVQAAIQGAKNVGLLCESDRIISKWHTRLEYGYPTPFLGRDKLLNEVQPVLKNMGIYSRGRFGGWKYEVGNQDHSLMQGVEAVNNIILGKKEQTYFFPHDVNHMYNPTSRIKSVGN